MLVLVLAVSVSGGKVNIKITSLADSRAGWSYCYSQPPRTRSTTPAAGHTSVKMSTTKRKSPARTGLAPPQFNRSISGPDPRNKTQYNRSKSANDDRLNDPEVQAKIGNRMTKTVDKTIGKCGMCMKPVTVEGCTAFGKVYHKECFKCGNCRRRIDGKFFQRNDKPYCEKCYAVSHIT